MHTPEGGLDTDTGQHDAMGRLVTFRLSRVSFLRGALVREENFRSQCPESRESTVRDPSTPELDALDRLIVGGLAAGAAGGACSRAGLSRNPSPESPSRFGMRLQMTWGSRSIGPGPASPLVWVHSPAAGFAPG